MLNDVLNCFTNTGVTISIFISNFKDHQFAFGAIDLNDFSSPSIFNVKGKPQAIPAHSVS